MRVDIDEQSPRQAQLGKALNHPLAADQVEFRQLAELVGRVEQAVGGMKDGVDRAAGQSLVAVNLLALQVNDRLKVDGNILHANDPGEQCFR